MELTHFTVITKTTVRSAAQYILSVLAAAEGLTSLVAEIRQSVVILTVV